MMCGDLIYSGWIRITVILMILIIVKLVLIGDDIDDCGRVSAYQWWWQQSLICDHGSDLIAAGDYDHS